MIGVIVLLLIVAVVAFLAGAALGRWSLLRALEQARVRARGRDQIELQELLRKARGRMTQ